MFEILLEQMLLFVIYIVVGILLVKAKVLDQVTLEPIARFVLKLAMPVMIFTNTVNGVDRETLIQSASILVLTAIFYVCTFLLAKGLAAAFRLQGDRSQVYRALSMFGNIGFMGIPIISSIFPDKGMLYISVFTIIDQLVLWTLGVKLTTPSGQGRFQARKLVNPCTVAIVLAALFVVAEIPLPGLLNTALTKIGATATPLAMIYLGGVFACINIRAYVRFWEFYGIAVVKMGVLPLVLYVLIGLFPVVPEEIRLTMSLLAGMPAMSSIVMMAKASGSEGDYAMGGIFVTTLCSLVTIPVVSWIMQHVL